MTDTELINLLQQQDRKAQTYFVEYFQERVFRLALKLVLNEQDAEDAAQEALMDALLHITDFKQDSSLQTWLFRITTNRCFQQMRSKKRKKRFAILRSLFVSENEDELLPIQDPSTDINAIIQNKELSEALKTSLTAIPDSQRAAFSLVYLNDHSYQEAASILDTSVKALESLLSRAKKNLQNQLKAKGYEN